MYFVSRDPPRAAAAADPESAVEHRASRYRSGRHPSTAKRQGAAATSDWPAERYTVVRARAHDTRTPPMGGGGSGVIRRTPRALMGLHGPASRGYPVTGCSGPTKTLPVNGGEPVAGRINTNNTMTTTTLLLFWLLLHGVYDTHHDGGSCARKVLVFFPGRFPTERCRGDAT